LVRVGDDISCVTEHPSATVAERQARRRAAALGIEVIVIHDRWPPASGEARSRHGGRHGWQELRPAVASGSIPDTKELTP
jgi:hypothetical protein